jgi:hypothetical protein
MWTTIVSFVMPYITKYALPVLSAIILVLVLTVGYLHSENKDLNKELGEVKATSEQNDLLYERERLTAKETIRQQNQKIAEYKLDVARYTETINQKTLELQATRFTQQEQINKELSQDSTPTNQLKIMTRVMKDFANETN